MIKALILGVVLVAQPRIYKEPAVVSYDAEGNHVLANPTPKNMVLSLNCGLDFEEVKATVPSRTQLTVTILDGANRPLRCWLASYSPASKRE